MSSDSMEHAVYDREPLVHLIRRAQSEYQEERRYRKRRRKLDPGSTSSTSQSSSTSPYGSSSSSTSIETKARSSSDDPSRLSTSSSSPLASSSGSISIPNRPPTQATLPPPTPPSAADFYVPTLPGQPSELDLTLFSGHLPASYSLDTSRRGTIKQQNAVSDAHLFFLLAKAKHIAERPRLVIWFNGGPGCSSFDGALLEIGPVLVEGRGGDATLVENPGRWNEYADVLFIDQPAGTGYSYINKGKAVTELAPAAEQIVTFLDNFYSVFPEYTRMDTYLSGESYAGTTIPYLARAILASDLLSTRLKGLIIGNGWFDPAIQYPAYVAYGKERGFMRKKNRQTENVERLLKQCNSTLSTSTGRGHVLVGVCENLVDAVLQAGKTTFDNKKYCIGSYDVRPSTDCGEYPSGMKYAKPYLQASDVVEAFHATDKKEKWVQCNNTVGSQMWSPQSRPSIELVPALLEKMPMLWFAGDADLMCNWIGVHDSIEAMTWKGEKGFGNATEEEWFVNGTLAGTWKTARNMTFVKVLEAGHMVPIHQPYAAHDLLLRFMGVETLQAAGEASRIPSHLGNEKAGGLDGVIGKVAPNGGTLPAVISQKEKAEAAAASKAAAAVDLHGAEGQPIDKERELLYGPRRTGVLVMIILLVSLGIYGLLRWRARQRRLKGWVPRSASARAHLTASGSDRSLHRWSTSHSSISGTPISRYPSRSTQYRGREGSINLTETNLLQRIEEHEENGGMRPDRTYRAEDEHQDASYGFLGGYGDDGLEEAAHGVLTSPDEGVGGSSSGSTERLAGAGGVLSRRQW